MSRLKALLRVAAPRLCNTQQTVLHACEDVAQQAQHTQQHEGIEWLEFEALLAIVAPAYNTPAHEYAWAREAARGDLDAALIAYRLMAKEIEVIGK